MFGYGKRSRVHGSGAVAKLGTLRRSRRASKLKLAHKYRGQLPAKRT